MKILFLDIDGVLNSENTKTFWPHPLTQFTGLDPNLVNLYTGWLSQRDYQVVLSSSWRTDPRVFPYLNENGIWFRDITPELGTRRGIEIKRWLDNNADATHFAILDDMSDTNPVGAHLVQTSAKKGVTVENLRRVDFLLGNVQEEKEVK